MNLDSGIINSGFSWQIKIKCSERVLLFSKTTKKISKIYFWVSRVVRLIKDLLLGRAGASPTLLSSMHSSVYYPARPTLLSSMHSSVYYILYIIYYILYIIYPYDLWQSAHASNVSRKNMASMLRPLRVCDRQKRKRLRNRCFATATDINGCPVARTIEVTMVGTARSIEITKMLRHSIDSLYIYGHSYR